MGESTIVNEESLVSYQFIKVPLEFSQGKVCEHCKEVIPDAYQGDRVRGLMICPHCELELSRAHIRESKAKIDAAVKEINDPKAQKKRARRRKLRDFWDRFKLLIISIVWAGVVSIYNWQLGIMVGSFLAAVWAYCEIDFYFFKKRLRRKDD